MKKKQTVFLFSLLLISITVTTVVHGQQPDEARVLRFPAIHGNTIVFTYAGDLYSVPSTGGTARKLTSHDGMELFPRFSPDGSLIAFTGQYDGNSEVYVMPAQGGVPKRITFTATLSRDDVGDRMGPNNLVMGWTTDGKNVVFRSRMISFNDFNGQLFLAPLTGDLPAQIPVPRGGFVSYAPDGKKMAYNRIFREFRTWKRYRGGMADDIWIFDFESKEVQNITQNPAQDIIPMWIDNRIYFLSDRDSSNKMNLFVYNTQTEQTRQLTFFSDFDIKFPSLGGHTIVFEQGGWLWRFDLNTEKPVKVPVFINDDRLAARGGIVKVKDFINGAHLAPDGSRALFTARGDLFTVPAKSGITRNISMSPGVHDRAAKWSPDGKWIAFISDATGEDEIYIKRQDGTGEAVQLTSNADTYKYQLEWSPDSQKILWSDRQMRLQFVDINTKKVTLIDRAESWDIQQFSWSPNSKWVAYGRPEAGTQNRIMLYSLDSGVRTPVTDGWYDAGNPAFSSDGTYLFFVSSRDFNPIYSWTEWNHAYQDMARIYFVTLKNSTESPFKPTNDEVHAGNSQAETEPEPAPRRGRNTPPAPPDIDLDGIGNRIVALPIPPSNYFNLSSTDGAIYYARNGSNDTQTQLFHYDLAKKQETNLGSIGNYMISADKKKMLIYRQGNYYILDVPKSSLDLKEALDVHGMEVYLDRHQEWEQIFDESWRQMKHFFYDPGMHGVDWVEVKNAYKPWLKGISHRADLTYVLGEMIGELNAGHAYVGGGDVPKTERVQTGLLGAQLERHPTGYYQIKKILEGENWVSNRRSPLTEPGLNVKEGEFILAVNGKTVTGMQNIFESLINTAGKPVILTLNNQPQTAGARDIIVKPIADESQLYYYNWVQDNIRKVESATNGRVGYIHIPNMGPGGLNEFVKHYYPQLGKDALIIDVRGNGGGNVSPMIIERLRREIAMVSRARDRVPAINPGQQILGPMVTLMDAFSASDGDIFPYRFREHGLGLLIGKRSWGGVVGIWGSLPFIDGGTLNRPESAIYDKDGKEWIIEGHGVDPDIVVDNDPWLEFSGTDQQLIKAIEVLLEKLEKETRKLPEPPPYPVKN